MISFVDRKRARYIAGILRQGPTEAGYAFFRARRRRRNLLDDEPELLGGDELALLPSVAAIDAAAIERHQATVDAQLAAGERDVRRVVWLFPRFHLVWGGGVATLLRMADRFATRHGAQNVFWVYNAHDAAEVQALRAKAVAQWPSLTAAEWLAPDAPVPAGDVLVATTWESAIAQVTLDAPAKVFVVQDWEPEFEPAGAASAVLGELAALGTPGIVNTPGLADAWRAAGSPAVAFTPAVDTQRFAYSSPAARAGEPVRIVVYGRPAVARNAFGLALASLRLVKQRVGDRVHIVSVGEDFSPGQYGAADVLENLGALESLDAVARVYGEADVGLCFMLTRHPSYQPLEWMASGVATVSNVNPHTAWLLRDGENALVTRALPALVADAIGRLVDDEALRVAVAQAGRATVQALAWEPELDRVWDALCGRVAFEPGPAG